MKTRKKRLPHCGSEWSGGSGGGMRRVRRLARKAEYAFYFLQLSMDERQWSVDRMAERVRTTHPRRFWWLAVARHPMVIGLELLMAIPTIHQAPDLFLGGLMLGMALAPALIVG